MNLNLSGHHLEITPALRSYVEDKLARLLGGSAQAKDTALSLSEPASQDSEAEDDATSDDILRTAGTPARSPSSTRPPTSSRWPCPPSTWH